MSEQSNSRNRGWRGPLVVAGIGLFTYGLALVLGRVPWVTEAVYGEVLGPRIAGMISRLSGLFPFSVGEVGVVLYVAWLLVLLARALWDTARGQRPGSSIVSGGVRRALVHGGALLTTFYVVWGFNYARAPLGDRMGWPAWAGVESSELVALAAQAVRESNRTYEALHGSVDAGAPTAFPADPAALDAALARGWAAARDLGLGEALARSFGPVKRPLGTGVLARLGVAGVYFPFTAEANVLRGLPPVSAVHSMAHEQAHQRGFANEAEASFAGFVVGTLAPDPLARYSSAVFASRQLMAAVARQDRKAYARLQTDLVPGVRRDLVDAAEFWAPYRGVGMTIGSAVNHRYLRANRVPGGIASYGLSVRLLVELARQSDGNLFPAVATPLQVD